MVNDRFRQAVQEAGLQLSDVAAHVGIDVKTAERWVTRGRLPHARNRAQAAELLGVPEDSLWPEACDQRQGADDVVRLYPHRGAVPPARWHELLDDCDHQLDVLVHAGLFLADGRADLAAAIRGKAEAGVTVRLLYGDPQSAAVALRGAEEGIGDGLAARINLALTYLRDAIGAPGVKLRLHDTALYNSIYRYDDEMLVNMHCYGMPAAQSPVLHIRKTPAGRLFDHYAASFDCVWGAACVVDVGKHQPAAMVV